MGRTAIYTFERGVYTKRSLVVFHINTDGYFFFLKFVGSRNLRKILNLPKIGTRHQTLAYIIEQTKKQPHYEQKEQLVFG